MTPMHLTFVDEPPNQWNPPCGDEHARFLEDISVHAGARVSFLQGLLQDVAPEEGFILLHPQNDPRTSFAACPPERRAELAARTILIGVGRTKIIEKLLEPLSVAGAVDSTTIREWLSQAPTEPGAEGVWGAPDVGALVGASCPLPLKTFQTERYCYLKSPTHRGLPHLLVDYLTALQAQRA